MFAITIDATPFGLFLAFLGGVVSILSPCVLPVLPGLVGVVSGTTLKELEDSKRLRSAVIQFVHYFQWVFFGFHSYSFSYNSIEPLFLR
jgi:cytochrome c biogenesis protein CcdA